MLPTSVRFTAEEKAWLLERAGALSLAAFIRLKVLQDAPKTFRNQEPTRRPSSELAVLGQMLGGLGRSGLASSMGDLAKAVKSGALPVSPELEQELQSAAMAIQDMRRALISALGVKVQ
ncbi:MAG: hypothetical protein AAFW83_08950 [Pseudomonadota bacterium]